MKYQMQNVKSFASLAFPPLLVRMVHPTISTRLSHLKKMDWTLGKWEMLRWILQKLAFWRSIYGLHIVLKVQNRGQPIQNYWCRRPYCLSVKGLAIIDLPWSSFGKCFCETTKIEDGNLFLSPFPPRIDTQLFYKYHLSPSLVFLIYLEERFACSGAR